MTISAVQTFATILALPVSKLQSASVLTDTTRVFASLHSDEDLLKYAPDDDFIVVRPKDFPPDPGCQAGGGTAIVKIDGKVEITLWHRLWIDQASRSDQWMTNSTLGVAAKMSSITTALEQYMPTDSSGNYQFIQPMRLVSPGWVFQPQKLGDWGRVVSMWSVVWWLSV